MHKPDCVTVTDETIQEIRSDTAEAAEEMAEREDLEYTEDFAEDVADCLLEQAYDFAEILNETDAPKAIPDYKSPDQHIITLHRQMKGGGEPAQTNLSFIVGLLSTGDNDMAQRWSKELAGVGSDDD